MYRKYVHYLSLNFMGIFALHMVHEIIKIVVIHTHNYVCVSAIT